MLHTEMRNQRTTHLDKMTPLEIAQAMNYENMRSVEAVEAVLNPTLQRSLSNSVLETLAIVAYRQPVTRGEIEEVRGVRCEYAVERLLKLGLIAISGRKDVPGRPMLLVTTDTFLHKFNLTSLDELPQLPQELFETV